MQAAWIGWIEWTGMLEKAEKVVGMVLIVVLGSGVVQWSVGWAGMVLRSEEVAMM